MSARRTQPRPPSLQESLIGIASSRVVHAAFDFLRKNEPRWIDEQLAMLHVPAPPFAEGARAAWLSERFRHAGLADVHIDEAGNVIGTRRGSADCRRTLLISAHIDTVFSSDIKYEVRCSQNGLATRIDAPGASDNSVGVVALLAVASALAHANVVHPSDIVFVGNVGEEGEGDLRGMRHLFSAQSPLHDSIAAALVLDGTGNDAIVTDALGSKRFEITARGLGGHSWQDYGRPNPINALARAISLFQDAPVPSEPRTTTNIGSISGGTSVNTIPETATMRVDIRSTSAAEIDRLVEVLRRSVQLAVTEQLRRTNARKAALTAELRQIGDRPAGALPSDSPLLHAVNAVDAHLCIHSHLKRRSTDANIPLSLGIPAVSIGAGGTGGGAHTLGEWFDSTGRDLALKRILLIALLVSETVASE